MQQSRTSAFTWLKTFLEKQGSTTIASAVYKRDFVQANIDSWSKNQIFRSPSGDEYEFFLWGEVCSRADGTLLGAIGNHYPGPNRQNPSLIGDNSTLKMVLCLKCPDDAPQDLKDTFRDQIVTLAEVRDSDAEDEIKRGQIFFLKEAIKNLEGVEDAEPDSILMCLPQLYMNPERRATSTPNTPTKRNMKRKRDDTSQPAAKDPTISLTTVDVLYPDVATLSPGQTMDPRVMADYGGPLFKQIQAMAVQPDVRDNDGALIPLWKIKDTLQEGTLVLVRGVLNIWIVPIDGGSKKRIKERKIYQINTSSIRVLANAPDDTLSEVISTEPAPAHSNNTVDVSNLQNVTIPSLHDIEVPYIVRNDGESMSSSVASSSVTQDLHDSSQITEDVDVEMPPTIATTYADLGKVDRKKKKKAT